MDQAGVGAQGTCPNEGTLTRPELLRVTPNADTDLGTDSAQEQHANPHRAFRQQMKQNTHGQSTKLSDQEARHRRLAPMHDSNTRRNRTRPRRPGPPLDRLVNELVHRRAGHIAVGRTALNRWLFPGAAPGRPLSPPRLSARLRRLGIPTRLARNTTLIDLAAQLPAAVLSQLLGLHLQTATSWTIEAGNTRMRYAATIAASTRPDEVQQKTNPPN